MSLENIWAEKYRPKTLDDMILDDVSKEYIQSLGNAGEIPHLLFVTPPGRGKTTLAKIIVNDVLKCQYMYLNASDENGINTVRQKIVNFAQTASIDGKVKVIILDEADGLTNEGMSALRNIMEENAAQVRFILTANYKHKIIDAIKSRCTEITFTPSKKDICRFALRILEAENISIPDIKILGYIVKTCYPDIRRLMNTLQKNSRTGILTGDVSLADDWIGELMQIKDPIEARKWCISNGSLFNDDYHYLLKSIFEWIYVHHGNIPDASNKMVTVAEAMYKHNFVMDPEINAFACLISILRT